MRRVTRRWPMAVVLMLALAACTASPAAPAAWTPTAAAALEATPQPATPTEAATAAPEPSTPTAAPSPPGLAFASIPNPFERRHLAAGTPIAECGVFFLNVATGEVEAWVRPGWNPNSYSISLDNRWLIAGGSYLADRQTGATYYLADGRILAAQGEHILLLVGEQLWVAEPGRPARGPLLTGITAPDQCQVVMSPDGEAAAILANGTLYLARLDGSDGCAVAEVADQPQGTGASLYPLAPRDEAIVVSSSWQEGEGAAQRTGRRVERYSWRGERLGELLLPSGSRCAFSPDGRLVAWDEPLADLTQAVVVADAATLAPRFRIAGATLCFYDLGSGDWLADSSGLIVRTQQGYRVTTLDGRLTPVPTPAGGPLASPDEPLPAPDRADLFAIGRRAVVDAAGETLATVALGAEFDRPGDLYPWGLDSSELRLALPHLGHGGKCGEGEYLLPARVERPPFGPLALAVGLPANDCVNLHAEPGTKAQVLACLPGGTRLSIAPLAEPRQSEVGVGYLTQSMAWSDNSRWLRVRAPDGQEGWVDSEAGNVGWVP